MSVIAWIGWVSLGVGLIGSFIAFDRLVDIEYRLFPERWRADGRPYGGKETRRRATFVRSGLARSVLMTAWMDQPPAWVRESAAARALIQRLRLFNALTMAGLLVALIASFLPALAG
jgi:hypothetical protein